VELSTQGFDLLGQREAKRNKAYRDSQGIWTIGIGHTGPEVVEGLVWTDEQVMEAFAHDSTWVLASIALVRAPLEQNQFDALVSFQFNTGWLEHQHCSLLNALNAGAYDLADQDFMLYDRASGKKLAGLDRRREAERALFHKPVTA
jgi:lysozyme